LPRWISLCEQVDQRLVNKRPLEKPRQGGAFDSMATGPFDKAQGRPTAAIRARLSPRSTRRSSTAADTSAIARRDRTSCSAAAATATPIPAARSRCRRTALDRDAAARVRKGVARLYMSGHPLERFTEELKTFGAQRVADSPVAR